MAPSLVQPYQQYSTRGVLFVGLSECGRATCEDFVRELEIPWPNGYGAAKTIRSLVNGNPTVVVVGRDGRVVWCDRRSRRVEQWPERFPDDLGRAIEAALAAEYDRPGGPATAGG